MSYDTSEANSKKLDDLIFLIKGENDAPGVLRRIAVQEEVLFGHNGKPGIVTKVNVMWHAHIWILCTISAGIGATVTEIVNKLIKP